ncbi:tetratricopeptide repeat protein [Anaerobacillus sp. HL2]|nr:tetratricopeptide repeat protein [Anaerobacillus sp. HL2]
MSNQPDLKLAEKYMRKALSYQKDHPVAHYRLAHLCYRQKDYGEAIYHFSASHNGFNR